ncbi:hypothetical protein SAY87_007961 [Trapa incisa]|uniref:Uncharacterized protein n=1 Tax=Trapa incisa TaxID=236973 RepID=A0AAN7KJF0_9MYRT|nr:hypothetical protein SAY87_007961 [Trapa incisa]
MAKNRVDNIAKYRQQARGPPPKRRADFSFFICSPSSKGSPVACKRTSSDTRDGLCNVATTGLNKLEEVEEGPRGCTIVPCSSQHDTRIDLSNGHPTENGSVDIKMQTNPFPDRDAAITTQEDDNPLTLEPQVLNVKDETDSQRQLFESPDKKTFLNQMQNSSGGLTLSNSTELEDESSERGRGKRKRKPKVHFDEEQNLPLKSVKKVRRFKIMRHLGLMAPLGSPY